MIPNIGLQSPFQSVSQAVPVVFRGSLLAEHVDVLGGEPDTYTMTTDAGDEPENQPVQEAAGEKVFTKERIDPDEVTRLVDMLRTLPDRKKSIDLGVMSGYAQLFGPSIEIQIELTNGDRKKDRVIAFIDSSYDEAKRGTFLSSTMVVPGENGVADEMLRVLPLVGFTQDAATQQYKSATLERYKADFDLASHASVHVVDRFVKMLIGADDLD